MKKQRITELGRGVYLSRLKHECRYNVSCEDRENCSFLLVPGYMLSQSLINATQMSKH